MSLNTVNLAYCISSKGKRTLATQKPKELSDLVWVLLQTGADSVAVGSHGSNVRYVRTNFHAAIDPPGLYLTYELRTD